MTLFEFVQQDTTLRRVGKDYRGACPVCGGGRNSDRFIVWPEPPRFWCRQCHIRGDAISYLRTVRHLSFADAARAVGKSFDPKEREIRRADRQLLSSLRHGFEEWTRAKMRHLTFLLDAIWIVEGTYTELTRHPERYTDAEHREVETLLGNLYTARDVESYETDMCVDPDEQETAGEWWLADQGLARMIPGSTVQ